MGAAVVAVWEMLARLIYITFSLSFYTIFSHPKLFSLAAIVPT
jgi:hypothetical protein